MSIITPEERAQWRKDALEAMAARADFNLSPGKNYERILSLLDALESAESDAAKFEADYYKLMAEADAFVEMIHQNKARAEKAEAERNWVADRLADVSDKMNRIDKPETDVCIACGICTDEFVETHENEGYGCFHAILDAATEVQRKGGA